MSVSDKTGIVDFAEALAARGVELLSTGGTAAMLAAANIKSREVSDYTGFPEIMAGRVKTLHPKIHGGLLGRRGIDDDVMASHDIAPIDLLVINLYPFEQTVARDGCTFNDGIENIDIGGPAMLRAAAKNHADVIVVCDPADYTHILREIDARDGAVGEDTRMTLAAKAFAQTARYDGAIAAWMTRFTRTTEQPFAATLTLQFSKRADLRYGENPHQSAAFYVDTADKTASVATAEFLQGRALSYNNIADADAAVECVRQFYEPACVIVKHANPCGVAIDTELAQAYRRAFSTDPESAFGGIIAVNQTLDPDTANEIISRQFVEVIIAPEVTSEAREIISSKPRVRLLRTGPLGTGQTGGMDYKRVTGGMLAQDRDSGLVESKDLEVVTERAPGEHEIRDMLFAWKVAKFVKSNAIVYAKDLMTIGVGAGQMSRVYSARIAAMKAVDAGLGVKGSVMASDAFFPFRDGIDNAAGHGVTAVIQPGGSIRDKEIIAAANEHDIAMVLTGMRHFRH